MNEERNYEKYKDGIKVIIRNEDKLTLPGDKEPVGTFIATTEQFLDKIGARKYLDFIINEKKKNEDAINQLNEDLKKVEHVKDSIPDELLSELAKAQKKGSKTFKQQTIELNKYLYEVAKKRNVLTKLSEHERVQKVIEKDYNGIKKLIK